MSTDLHLPVNLDGLDCFNTSINTDSLSCGNAIYLEGRFVSRRKEMEILSLERYFLIGEEILSRTRWRLIIYVIRQCNLQGVFSFAMQSTNACFSLGNCLFPLAHD
jgi:hypothetical protein